MRWEIENTFPDLIISGYEITSDATERYNCIAWAANDDTVWWGLSPDDYWPESVPRSPEVSALIQVFANMGYAVCNGDEREAGYEKVAIYARDGLWEHAARQLADGRWTSKLGIIEDIIHPSLANLAGEIYGDVYCIMRRPSNL